MLHIAVLPKPTRVRHSMFQSGTDRYWTARKTYIIETDGHLVEVVCKLIKGAYRLLEIRVFVDDRIGINTWLYYHPEYGALESTAYQHVGIGGPTFKHHANSF